MRSHDHEPRIISQDLQDLGFNPIRGLRAHWGVIAAGTDIAIPTVHGTLHKNHKDAPVLDDMDVSLTLRYFEQGDVYTKKSDKSRIVYIHGSSRVGDNVSHD